MQEVLLIKLTVLIDFNSGMILAPFVECVKMYDNLLRMRAFVVFARSPTGDKI